MVTKRVFAYPLPDGREIKLVWSGRTRLSVSWRSNGQQIGHDARQKWGLILVEIQGLVLQVCDADGCITQGRDYTTELWLWNDGNPFVDPIRGAAGLREVQV